MISIVNEVGIPTLRRDSTDPAPSVPLVVQWTEQRSSKAHMGVRFPPRAKNILLILHFKFGDTGLVQFWKPDGKKAVFDGGLGFIGIHFLGKQN